MFKQERLDLVQEISRRLWKGRKEKTKDKTSLVTFRIENRTIGEWETKLFV